MTTDFYQLMLVLIIRSGSVPRQIIRIQLTVFNEATRVWPLLLQGSPSNAFELVPSVKAPPIFDCRHYLGDFAAYSFKEVSSVLGKDFDQGLECRKR